MDDIISLILWILLLTFLFDGCNPKMAAYDLGGIIKAFDEGRK